MSADVLRQAASLMRSRAEAATPGPWELDDGLIFHASDGSGSGEPMYVSECYGDDYGRADAAHIAALHPAVALAVAAWLDSEADAFEAHMDRQSDPERRMNAVWLVSAQERHDHALTVATAYLGTP